MRKFFSVVLFALFAFSLVTMTGCSSEITTTVIDQVTNDDYAYTVTQKSQKSFFYEEEYTVEFWGGTRAQRADITNAPFYRKYVTALMQRYATAS
ncbi:MAG: hypothetical protein QG642_85 [Patescibacteria group bacterium]|nr:hypothetical protein [Patescibacteria group bacterium]